MVKHREEKNFSRIEGIKEFEKAFQLTEKKEHNVGIKNC